MSTGSPIASPTCASHGLAAMEATKPAEDAWVDHVNEVAHTTLFPQAWYMGANIPGKPRIFMPYIGGVRLPAEVRRGRRQGL